MAQDLFKEIRYVSTGDFSQEEIIENDIVVGKRLPTSEVIFTSDSDQIIFLELWNEGEKEVDSFIRVGDRIIQNNRLVVCNEEKMAHNFHKIEIKKGEQISASADIEKSITYNIIL